MFNSSRDASLCRFCEADALRQVFQFLPNAYGDLFEATCEIAKNLERYSIAIARCNSCKLLQLMQNTHLDLQYLDYLYLTSVTNNLAKYYQELTSSYMQELGLERDQYILDIGSNDGAFLKSFLDAGFPVLGVDPSGPASRVATERGISTINDYFSSDVVEKIKLMKIGIGLISVNYTLANVPSIRDFFRSVSALSTEKTYFSIITGYHPDQFAINMFDYIGHDHLTYFSVSDLKNIANEFGFNLVDVERIEHKGGSIRLLLTKSNLVPKSSVAQILQRENWMNVSSDTYILEMFARVEYSKQQLNNALAQHKNVGGIGASISTSYLSVHYQITDKISVLFDDDPQKIGRFSPGSGIEVQSLKRIATAPVDCVVILAWQHTLKLLDRLKEENFHGTILIPLPVFKSLKM